MNPLLGANVSPFLITPLILLILAGVYLAWKISKKLLDHSKALQEIHLLVNSRLSIALAEIQALHKELDSKSNDNARVYELQKQLNLKQLEVDKRLKKTSKTSKTN